jgi:hypothetical protein
MRCQTPSTPCLRATPKANSTRLIKSNFSADQLGWNPIILRFLPFFPECSALASRTFATSRFSNPCVTSQRSGSAAVLPALHFTRLSFQG